MPETQRRHPSLVLDYRGDKAYKGLGVVSPSLWHEQSSVIVYLDFTRVCALCVFLQPWVMACLSAFVGVLEHFCFFAFFAHFRLSCVRTGEQAKFSATSPSHKMHPRLSPPIELITSPRGEGYQVRLLHYPLEQCTLSLLPSLTVSPFFSSSGIDNVA